MAVPESDLKLFAAWCEQHTPEHVRDQVWIEYDVTPRHVDIMECRPDWMDPQNRPTMRFPIARQVLAFLDEPDSAIFWG